MDSNQLLVESRRRIDEGLLSLEALEHQCLRSSITADALVLTQVHTIRSKLQEIRSSLDTLVSISGAPDIVGLERRQLLESIAEHVDRTIGRIDQMRLQAERNASGGEVAYDR